MNKVAQRFLVFFLGVPAVAALVLLLPHHNHLAFNIVLVIFSALGAMEFSAMLAQKDLRISKVEAAIIGAILPTLAVLLVLGFSFAFIAVIAAPAIVTVTVSWLLLSRVFSGGDKLDGFICRFAGGLSVLLYPGIFLVWLIAMSRWDNAGIIIMTFMVLVFGGDSLAWATGMLFGKGNRGVVPASPNKSMVGFVGGVIGPVVIGMGAVSIWPHVFVTDQIPPLVAGAVIGLLTGIAAVLGDLAESALKRSSGVKDSGSFIMGRGGALDSIDSVAMAAPVFYICFSLLFVR